MTGTAMAASFLEWLRPPPLLGLSATLVTGRVLLVMVPKGPLVTSRLAPVRVIVPG